MAEAETTTLPTPIPTPLNVTALAKRFGVARSTIQRRLKKGWTPPTKAPRKLRKAAPDAAPDAAPIAAPVAAPVTLPEPRLSTAANLVAYAAAVMLASVAAYFSVSGMTEIFPGAPVAIIALAAVMEIAKLVIAGWLSASWRMTGWLLRSVLITIVAGLAVLNGVGVYGRLVEAHLGVTVAAASSVAERIAALDARITEQAHTVAGIDTQVSQIDEAISKLTEKGSPRTALRMADEQRKVRDGLVTARQKAAEALVELRADRAKLDGERARVEASTGPIRYLATMAGMDTEQAIRWLILLMVLCCDPAAIALTVAASRRPLL
jgi:uncharacterized coiled-coil protein SlyX